MERMGSRRTGLCGSLCHLGRIASQQHLIRLGVLTTTCGRQTKHIAAAARPGARAAQPVVW